MVTWLEMGEGVEEERELEDYYESGVGLQIKKHNRNDF